MRVGIIAEGPTDQRVIEAIIRGVVNGHAGEPLELLVNDVQPALDHRGTAGHGGWGLVFQALRERQHIEALQANDYLVIQIDTDVCEEIGFDVQRREAGVELDEATLIARVIARLERDMGADFVANHWHRVAYAIAVNELECWLLPLVYDDSKASKRTGCYQALHHRLQEQKQKGLLQPDGRSKSPARYAQVAAPLRKAKNLARAREESPSLDAFASRLEGIAAAHRMGPPPIPVP